MIMPALLIGARLLSLPVFAFLNRARGTRLFEHTTSTMISRIVSMGLMAAYLSAEALMLDVGGVRSLCLLAWAWASLLLWCDEAWDDLWSACIGHDPNHSRLWGLMMLTLRMSLGIPYFVGVAYITGHSDRAWYAAASLLLGLPYYIWGYLQPNKAINFAEPTVGTIIAIATQAII